MWPNMPVPTLLKPAATRKHDDDDDDDEDLDTEMGEKDSFFIENTLPTSMLIAALVAHATQPRSTQQCRHAAALVLWDILRRQVQSGGMTVRFTTNTNVFNVEVPTGGGFPTGILLGLLGEQAFQKVKRAWNKDAQDRG